MRNSESKNFPSNESKRFFSIRRSFLIIVILVSVASLFAFMTSFFLKKDQKEQKNQQDQQQIVAITQIVSHPSLELIKKGIKDTIKAQNKDAVIDFQNAYGKISTSEQIANKFIEENASVIMPITTMSAKSVFDAIKKSGKSIPMVFVGVTDPFVAGIVKEGVFGVSDFPPIKKQIDFMKKTLGNKLRNLGVIYNSAEINSVVIVDELEKELKGSRINLIRATMVDGAEIEKVFSMFSGKVDAVYLPSDNTIMSFLPNIIKYLENLKVPVFSSDPESVEIGCFASIAQDQYRVGVQAANIAIKILEKKQAAKKQKEQIKKGQTEKEKKSKIKEPKIEKANDLVLTVNKEVMKKLGLKEPSDMGIKINFVNEG